MALLSTWLLPTDLDEKQNAAALTPEEAGVFGRGWDGGDRCYQGAPWLEDSHIP